MRKIKTAIEAAMYLFVFAGMFYLTKIWLWWGDKGPQMSNGVKIFTFIYAVLVIFSVSGLLCLLLNMLIHKYDISIEHTTKAIVTKRGRGVFRWLLNKKTITLYDIDVSYNIDGATKWYYGDGTPYGRFRKLDRTREIDQASRRINKYK